MAEGNTQTVSGSGAGVQNNGISEKAAAAFGSKAASTEGINYALWGLVITTIITALGAYKQFEMFRKMGNLAQEQADATKVFSKIQKDVFDKITLPQHKKADTFFWSYLRGGFVKDIEKKVSECGLKYCEYQGDEEEDISSAYADAYEIINNLRLKSKRSTSPFQVGECCDNSFRLDDLEARMLVTATSAAKRRYDDKKLKFDTLYWNKYLGVAQMAQNTQQVGANLLVGAGTAIQNSLNSQGQTLRDSDLAVQSQFAALNGQQATIGAATTNLNGSIGSFVGQQNANQYQQNLQGIFNNLRGFGTGPNTGSASVLGASGSDPTGSALSLASGGSGGVLDSQ